MKKKIKICIVGAYEYEFEILNRHSNSLIDLDIQCISEDNLHADLFLKHKKTLFVFFNDQNFIELKSKYSKIFSKHPILVIEREYNYDYTDNLHARDITEYAAEHNFADEFIFALMLAIRYKFFLTEKMCTKYAEYKDIIVTIRKRLQDIKSNNATSEAFFIELFKHELGSQDLQRGEANVLANHDRNTGLPNEKFMNDFLDKHLHNAVTEDGISALFAIKLDSLHEMNRRLGVERTDIFINRFTKRLLANLPHGCVLSRYMQNLYLILVDNVSKIDELTAIAENMLSICRAPIMRGDENIFATISIGIALYPMDANNRKLLVENATSAADGVHDAGGNAFEFFDAKRSQEQKRIAIIAASIEDAYVSNSFKMLFQPIVSLESGEVLHYEALIRWWHKDLGDISPEEFIPVAEQYGKIKLITSWVLDNACRIAAELKAKTKHPKPIAINLSAKDFRGEIYAEVKNCLEKYNLNNTDLGVEITETAVVDDKVGIKKNMDALHRLGVKISLDDFGSGYAGISRLYELPLDYIKIDGSFVSQIGTKAEKFTIVEALILIANKLDMEIIAEWVETDYQRQRLLELGCNYGQGYLFSKPENIEHFYPELT